MRGRPTWPRSYWGGGGVEGGGLPFGSFWALEKFSLPDTCGSRRRFLQESWESLKGWSRGKTGEIGGGGSWSLQWAEMEGTKAEAVGL